MEGHKQQSKPSSGSPAFPRKRKLPKRYDEVENQHVFENVKLLHKKYYYEAYDFVINGIKTRFNQPDYKTYASMQNVVLGVFNRHYFDDDFNKLAVVYENDLDIYSLRTQLSLLPAMAEKLNYQVGEININEALDILKVRWNST